MKQRLYYFDMLKGLAIFLVVMGHVITMCIREIDRAPLFKFIGEVHMPLFFFISGWFSMRCKDNQRPETPSLIQRASRLLIPMIVVSTLWVFYFPGSGIQSPLPPGFEGLWSSSYKNGYWFTLVLFEITAVYAAATYLLGKQASLARECAVTGGGWIILVAITMIIGSEISAWTSLDLTSTFFPVFMAGAIARRHKDAFNAFSGKSSTITAALLIASACFYYIGWPWNVSFHNPYLYMVCRVLLHLCFAIIGIAAVRPWSERAFADGTGTVAARLWAFLGRKSLAVYLLHYFFLFPLWSVKPAMEAMNLNLVPLAVFAAVVAAAVISMVLIADYIIGLSAPLAFLLTGTEPAAKNKSNLKPQQTK